MKTVTNKKLDLKFGHIEIFAKDPERSMRFYCDILGFELEVIQGGQNIWIKKGDIEILLRPGRPSNPAQRYEHAPTGFVLYTDDVHKTLDELVGRGLEIRGTVDSEKCFTFTDPDGNWFQLVDPHDH